MTETAGVSWAAVELGGASLGDARLNRQLVRVAERQRAEQARQQAEAAKRRREADQYWAQAVELRRQGDRAATMQAIEKGLALVPDHEGLTRLRQEMSVEITAQQNTVRTD